MSDHPILSAPAFVGKLLRWMMLAAGALALLALLLPASLLLAPLGLLLIVALALLANGRLPLGWLACVNPTNLPALRGAGVTALVGVVLVLALILFSGPLLIALVLGLVVLAALGWSGIGPLAGPAQVLRGLVLLIGLLPRLRVPLNTAAQALGDLAHASDQLGNGLDAADSHLGDARAVLGVVAMPTISVAQVWNNVPLPGGHGDLSVPGLNITQGTEKPFADVASGLGDVQNGLRDARDAARQQRDALNIVAAAIGSLRDLLPAP